MDVDLSRSMLDLRHVAAALNGLGNIAERRGKIREIVREYQDTAQLVDLDQELTGRNNLYRDVVHMGRQGDAEKAAAVGRAIFEDARKRFAR